MTQLAIFASGAGSNADKIMDYFKDSDRIKVALIVCNKPGAGVLEIAKKWGIEAILIEKQGFFSEKSCILALKQHKIDFIVLAGFLWKVPEVLVAAYPQRIINIHPALLPKYGGKGMYGDKVHAAVIAAGEAESGITIHYVNEHYDEGNIIFQAKCPIEVGDTPADLATKIHALEHAHFAKVVEGLLV
ncbi:MAG: phosphoribosylglycinamide formyltransferase 1 [Chitinophagaceae bacterium]|nr:MAG: phosphoribosylglycinamide formyltransferase 1 [Chitinophagaceae bacterium]